MKLIDALRVASSPAPQDGPTFRVSLVCGFTALHLKTYLLATLRLARPDARIEVSTGVFDDLLGNLERAQREVDAVVVIAEWADIDPRLGLRRVGGWRQADREDIEASLEVGLSRLAQGLEAAAQGNPVILVLPTLALPPVFLQHPGQSGELELRLQARLATLAASLASNPRIRVCSPEYLDELSTGSGRRDVKAELSVGFPFSLEHAYAVASAVSALVLPAPAKKGLITDLDGTLWAGIVGEVGPENVSWSLDDHSHRHALYQQLLASLADAGVMIAIASKNDPRMVDLALRRTDLLLSAECLYPIEVHWGPKSDSVRRILAAWNVSPDAAVMVDDSPLELAEVGEVFTDMERIHFPDSDDDRIWDVLVRLRRLFGKTQASAEDRLRVASLRAAAEFHGSADDATLTADEFLAKVDGRLEVTVGTSQASRALELLNKTNQFNLNGRRVTEAALQRALDRAGCTLITVDYEDKYGPLGVIAALLARHEGATLFLDSWVMSCRAFSRRIEHHCVKFLFDRFDVDRIGLDYRATERNEPVRDFLSSLLAAPPNGHVCLTRAQFGERAPLLVHRVVDATLGVC